MDYWGRRAPVPGQLKLSTTLNNPNQLDQEIIDLVDLAMKAIQRSLLRIDPKQGGELLSSLQDSLHAARYHQRQFLARYGIVHGHYAPTQVSGSSQIEIEFNDHPLQFEFEATLIRVRGSLDAAAKLALLCLGEKPDTFGAYVKFIESESSKKLLQREKLYLALKKNERWLNEDRKYRNRIAHDGNLSDFRGVKIGADGIQSSRLVTDDSAEYCIRLWRRLSSFLTKTFEALR